MNILEQDILEKANKYNIDQLKNLLEEYKKLLKSNSDCENQKIKIKFLEDKKTNLLSKLENEKIKLEKIEKENLEINEHIKKLNDEINRQEYYKKNDYNESYSNKQLEKFYDIVINIKSLSSLTKPEGWPIEWNIKRKEVFERIKNKNLFKVGVLGNTNVGKTFLFSRLFNIDIPSGYSIITKGLSLKYNEDESFIILDSAGFQTPLIKDEELILDDSKNENEVSKNEEKHLKDDNLYKDKIQTEKFIQNLIIYESDMLLVVVGKLTFNEQRLINKIKKGIESGSNGNNKIKIPIYIIHNLLNFQTKKQVEDYIKDILLKSASFNITKLPYFDLRNKNKGNDEKRTIFVENENENEVQAYHLIMAREETEAGNYYNDFTYHFLKEQFNLFTKRKPLSIIEEVKNRFIEWSNDLLEESINKNNIEIVKDENNKEIKYIFIESEDKKDNNKIIPKACISDELDLSIYRSNGYEPPYYFYIENEEKLVLVLEIPGENKIEEVYANIDTKEIIVKGNKSKKDSIKPLYNSTKFGKFNLHIPYGTKVQIGEEDPIEGEELTKDGIYTCKFKLIKKRNNVKRNRK